MKKKLIIAPLILSIHPTLFLFLYNINKVTIQQIFLPLIISVFISLLIFSLFYFTLSNNYNAISILSSFFILIFFSYGHIIDSLQIMQKGTSFQFARLRYIIPFIISFSFGFVYYILKMKKAALKNLSKTITTMASVIMLITLFRIVTSDIEKIIPQKIKDIKHHNYPTLMIDSLMRKSEVLPDVYYIILDAYTNNSVLKKLYKYDNSTFESYLKNKGFIVYDESYSNYPNTINSLTSSMNLNYLSNFEEYLTLNQKKFSERRLYLFQNNQVNSIFQSLGYKTVNIGGDHTSFNNKYFDVNINVKTSEELLNQLIRTSMLLHADDVFGILKRNRIIDTFHAVSKITNDKDPTFTFAHILVPHGPHVFDRNGDAILFSNMFYENKTLRRGAIAAERYLDQLIYTNILVKELVNHIINESPEPPIIIMQGDHGNNSLMPEGDWLESPSDEILFEVMGNLNTFYLPNCDSVDSNKNITPVNTFRFVLNNCFGADLYLLDDKHYYTHKSYEYYFTDVTEKINKFKIN